MEQEEGVDPRRVVEIKTTINGVRSLRRADGSTTTIWPDGKARNTSGGGFKTILHAKGWYEIMCPSKTRLKVRTNGRAVIFRSDGTRIVFQDVAAIEAKFVKGPEGCLLRDFSEVAGCCLIGDLNFQYYFDLEQARHEEGAA